MLFGNVIYYIYFIYIEVSKKIPPNTKSAILSHKFFILSLQSVFCAIQYKGRKYKIKNERE